MDQTIDGLAAEIEKPHHHIAPYRLTLRAGIFQHPIDGAALPVRNVHIIRCNFAKGINLAVPLQLSSSALQGRQQPRRLDGTHPSIYATLYRT